MIGTYMLLSLVTLIAYLLVVMRYIHFWKKVDLLSPQNTDQYPSVAVIIPFRNEAGHLGSLVEDLDQQNYPAERFHIYLINDHSTDDGEQNLEGLDAERYSLIHLSDQEEGKKAALLKGIEVSDSDLILFSDADTQRGPDWIKSMISAQVHQSKDMVTGPVLSKASQGFRKYYELELAAFMVVTAGAIKGQLHGMANGANMIVRRSSLPGGDPFRSDISPSGDDIFLAEHYFSRDQLAFCKDPRAIVTAHAPDQFDDFLQQKIRWASKSQMMEGRATRIAMGSLMLLPVLILTSPLLAVMYGAGVLWTGVTLLALKAVIDHRIILNGMRFNERRVNLSEVLRQQFLHLRITLSVVIHYLSQRGFRWKGRDL